MRITLKATNIAHTNAIDMYVGKRMRDLERVLDPKEQSQVVRIDIGTTTKHHKEGKDLYYAEVNFRSKKKVFHTTVKSADLYAAIDEMKDNIVNEVKNHHARVRTLAKEGARVIKYRLRRTA